MVSVPLILLVTEVMAEKPLLVGEKGFKISRMPVWLVTLFLAQFFFWFFFVSKTERWLFLGDSFWLFFFTRVRY